MDIRSIKEWIFNYGEEDNQLMREAIMCYQSGCYNASYLYSYLGFLEFIKKNVINHREVPINFRKKIPDSNVKNQQWSDVRKKISNEDKWEEELFNLINTSKDENIFMIQDAVRDEFKVKRHKRNVCAHNKDRSISHVDTEELWQFIIHTAPLMSVNGSVSLLQDEINDVYNYADQDSVEELISKKMKIFERFGLEEQKDFINVIIEIINEEGFRRGGEDKKRYQVYTSVVKNIFRTPSSESFSLITSLDMKLKIYGMAGFDPAMLDKFELRRLFYDDDASFIESILHFEDHSKVESCLESVFISNKIDSWWGTVFKIYSKRNEPLSRILVQRVFNDKKFFLGEIEEIEELYTYKAYNKVYETSTFDFLTYKSFLRNITLLMFSIKEFNYRSELSNNFLNRYFKLVDDCNDPDSAHEDYRSSYISMLERFRNNNGLHEWLVENREEILPKGSPDLN